MIDLSIVIVNWNTKDYLKNCLKSIYENTKGTAFEVMVVDNASSDGSAEMIRDTFNNIILIENKQNIGFGAANNVGIKKSRGKYILMLNPDTEILDNSLEPMVKFLDGNLKTGAVGPKILNPDGSIQFECARSFPTPLTEFFVLSTLYKRFPKSRIFGKYLMSYWDHNDKREVDVLSGACMMVRKEVFDEIGLFDENFFMYAEETDLFYRIKKQSWKVYFLPSVEIVHFWGKSTEQIPYAMIVEGRKSIELFFKKHYGVWAIVTNRLITVVVTFFIQIHSLLMYLLSDKQNKVKAKNIFLRNNFMLRWALGLK